MRYTNLNKPFCAAIIAGTCLIMGLNSVSADNNLSLKGYLQVNYQTNFPEILTGPEEAQRYCYLDRTTIFPGTGLVGDFYLFNHSDDTLKLAAKGQPILQFLSLKYNVKGDTIHAPGIIDVSLIEVVDYTVPEALRHLADGNVLPPHAKIEIDAFPTWQMLSSIKSGIIDFYWLYDNSSVTWQDTSVLPIIFVSSPLTVNFNLPPADKIDSIYYLNQKAFYQNETQQFQQSYATCLQILQLASNDFNALRTAADVLWKMNRFDEALPYAQQGIALIQSKLQELHAKGAYAADDESNEAIARLQFFIDKCQRREKWKWAK
jgi:hypothetical protein